MKAWLALVCSVSVVCMLYVLSVSCSYAVDTQGTSSAERFVRGTADNVLGVITKSVSNSEKSLQLERIFLNTVSIDWMAKFALSKNLRSMNATERDQYMDAYKRFLLKSYVPKFRDYNGQHIRIISSKDLGNNQFMVTTAIIDKDSTHEISVGYRCKVFSDGRMRVIDVIAENVSLMASQRSEFGSIIANGGVSSLIKRLNERAVEDGQRSNG